MDLDLLDGYPVRFDEDDMDVLDHIDALTTPLPGSLADFADWLSGNTAEGSSLRNPVSAEAMVPQEPVRNVCQTQYDAPSSSAYPTNQEQQDWSVHVQHAGSFNMNVGAEQKQLQQEHSQQQQQQYNAVAVAARQHSLSQTQASRSSQQQQQIWQPSAQRSGSVSSQAVNHAAADVLQQQYNQQQQLFNQQQQQYNQQEQLQQQQQQSLPQVWPLPMQQMPATQHQQQHSPMSAPLLLAPPASLGLAAATAAGTSSMLQPACSSAAVAALAVSAAPSGTFSAGTARAASFNLPLQSSGILLGPQQTHMSLQPTLVLSPAAATAVHPLAAAAAAASVGAAGLGLSLGGMGVLGAQQGQLQYSWQPVSHHLRQGDVLGPMMSPTAIYKHAAVARQQKVRRRNTVASLEAELAEKMGQLQLLTAENEMLKLRAGVLEATVQNREDQMRVVWEHGPPTFPIDCPDTPDRTPPSRGPSSRSLQERVATAAAAAGGHGCAGEGPHMTAACSGQLAGGGWGEEGSAGCVASPCTPHAGPGVHATVGGAATTYTDTTASSSSDGGPASAAGGCAGATADSPSSSSGSGLDESTFDAHTAQLPLPQQKDSLLSIKRMTADDIIRHWKQFLQEVTSALVQLQREDSAAAAMGLVPASAAAGAAVPGPGAAAVAGQEASSDRPISPAEQRVRDLVDKYCYLVRVAQTLNPSAYCRLFGRHLDSAEPVPYNDQHWRNVVAVLGLDKDQITHILACAELYFSSRAKLQAEQRALQAQLRAAEGGPLDLLSGTGAGAGSSSSSGEDNPLKPWLERLANNLKREHNLRIMLNSYVWGRIFTHLQKAKAAVYSHPLYVDIHALVCVMCEDALAAAGAPRGNAAQQQQQLQLQQQYAATYAACQQQMAAYAEFAPGGAQQLVM